MIAATSPSTNGKPERNGQAPPSRRTTCALPRKQILTPLQRRFVDEYLIDCNGAAAARRAGCSRRSANRIAAKWLSKVVIQEAIAVAMAARAQRTQITADRVLQELARVAFSNMQDVATWGPDGVGLKPSNQLNPGASACVAAVGHTRTWRGESSWVKLHNKVAALISLGKHLGLFNKPEPLDVLLARLPPQLAAELRQALSK